VEGKRLGSRISKLAETGENRENIKTAQIQEPLRKQCKHLRVN